MLVFKHSLFCLCILIFTSCNSKHDKIERLNRDDKNEILKKSVLSVNNMFKSKDWKAIYKMKILATENGIGCVDGSLHNFINMNNEVYLFTISNIKTLDYMIKNDTAIITQEINVYTYLNPQNSNKFTVYDYWVYKNQNWYLMEWNRLSLIKYLTRADSLELIESEKKSKKLIDSILKKIDK